jgi:hypothetical protein
VNSRRILGLVAATVLTLAAASPAASAEGLAGARLSPLGLGPVRVGMTPEQASQAAGITFDVGAPDEHGCVDWPTPGLAPYSAQLLSFAGDRTLGLVLLMNRRVATTRGVRLGDSVRKLRRRYRHHLRHGSTASLGGGSEFLFYDRRRNGVTYTLEFGLYKGKVSAMTAATRHTIKTFGECA